MGCTASRLEAKRRLILNKGRRRPVPVTLSSKRLLSSHREDMEVEVISEEINPNQNSQEITPKASLGIAVIISANNCGPIKVANKPIEEKKKDSPKLRRKKAVKFVDVHEDKDEDDDDDDDDEDDERRIGFEDGGASPSFRVYFDENREYSHNQETVKYGDAFTDKISTADIVSSKEVVTSHDVEKKVKRERMKRCFRKVLVLPKKGSQADIKRILNMKSCYSA